MIEDHKEDSEQERNTPDTGKLRRFALGTALALFVFVLGGGELRDELSAPLATIIHFQHPSVLLGLLVVATAYASFRYWYQAIHLDLTRAKIRNYLKTAQSILVFPHSEDDFSHQTDPKTSKGGIWWVARNLLLSKLPDGLPRSHCIVIGHTGDSGEKLQRVVATKIERYFPGLRPEDVSLYSPGEGLFWASINSQSGKRLWTCRLEDFDLWLPVYAGSTSILIFLGYLLWPWVSDFFFRL